MSYSLGTPITHRFDFLKLSHSLTKLFFFSLQKIEKEETVSNFLKK